MDQEAGAIFCTPATERRGEEEEEGETREKIERERVRKCIVITYR